jgi:hypothetical protein
MQVESTTVWPGMTGEYACRNEIKMIFETCTGIREKAFEDPVHREDRGTRIDCGIAHLHFTHFSAGSCRYFENADAESSMREIDGGGKAAHTGSDDRDVMSVVTHGGRKKVSYPTGAERPLSPDARPASDGR